MRPPGTPSTPFRKREPVTTWIVDDTGFSEARKRTRWVCSGSTTGSAGKIANCQIGVSLAVATGSEQIPIDFELYLPEAWASSAARRKEARIPSEVAFKTKPDLALEMIARAASAGIPGDVSSRRQAATATAPTFATRSAFLGFDFAVGVHAQTSVVRMGADDQPRGKPASASGSCDANEQSISKYPLGAKAPRKRCAVASASRV